MLKKTNDICNAPNHDEIQRSHQICDRDALLELADEISSTSCDKVDGELTVDLITVWGWAQVIREALGVKEGVLNA